MSTYYIHFGNVNIKEVISLTNWKLGDENGKITVEKAIEKQHFYITNGRDYLWLRTDKEGVIQSFVRYAGNSSEFLIDLIGYSVSEYDYDAGLIQYYYEDEEEDELEEWLSENTFFEEEKVPLLDN